MKRKASEFEENDNYGWPRPESPASYTSVSTNDSPQRLTIGPASDTTASFLPRSKTNFFDLRTRKRYRDDRPDSEVIHQNTIAKLFDAQRRAKFNPAPIPEEQSILHWSPVESNQRSIDSFFAPHHSNESNHDPQKFHPMMNMVFTDRCRLSCEGCGTDIICVTHMTQSTSQIASEEEYQCTNCARHVCDMCAVKGDYRICLECAMPGGGG